VFTDSTEVSPCYTLKYICFPKTYIFLLPTYLEFTDLYLNMFSIDLATRFKIEMYMLNREKRYLPFSEINRYTTSFKWIANR